MLCNIITQLNGTTGYTMLNEKTKQRKSLREPKMQRTQILLDPIQHKQLADLAHHEKKSMSEVVRQMLDEFIRARKRRSLEKAAEFMAPAYETDKELTAFSALDGEDALA